MSYYCISGNVLRFDALDTKKLGFHHLIIRAENIERLKGELPRGHFKITNRIAAKELKLSQSTIQRLTKEFKLLNIIKCIKKSKSSTEASIYEYIFDYSHESVFESINEPVNNNVQSSDLNTLKPGDKIKNEQVDKTVTDTLKKEVLKRKDIYRLVINRLNKRANKNFKPTSQKTQSHINARLLEKFTVEDFYKVIDTKCARWKDSSMDIFLRPRTLFGTKFEDYLNEYKSPTPEVDSNNSPWNPSFNYD
ncbi:Conserved phage C-terminus (Phg_2220_C) [uncultured Clostridium sp.]|nr:Conserved phage C-terminus (Phg_2220_C) [uncultured Clostridium sp.]